MSCNPRNASALSSFVEAMDGVSSVSDKVSAIQNLDADQVLDAYNSHEPDEDKHCGALEWDFMIRIASKARNRSCPFDWTMEKVL